MKILYFGCIFISFNFAFTSFLTELFELNDEQQETLPYKKFRESLKKAQSFENNLKSKQKDVSEGLLEKDSNHYISKQNNSKEIRTLKQSGIEYKDYPKFVATIQYWIEDISNGENDFYDQFSKDHKQEKETDSKGLDAEEKAMEEWVKKTFVKQHTEYNRFSKDEVSNKSISEIQEKRPSLTRITERRFNKQYRKKNNMTEPLEDKNQWRQMKDILERRMNNIAKLIEEK